MDLEDVPLWVESEPLGKGVLIEPEATLIRVVEPDDGARREAAREMFATLLVQALREGCGDASGT